MKRFIDKYLLEWKNSTLRKPLILRGARQVGKTYSVKQLGKFFENFVSINLELEPHIIQFFESDLYPDQIIEKIAITKSQRIIPGKTLLFFDEIQAAPRAITALRYFYELMPELHVIAEGSLIEFAIEHVGIPVGRVETLYMYPMSFMEFLDAIDDGISTKAINAHNPELPFHGVIHDRFLTLVGQYLAIGGMPEVVKGWLETKDFNVCSKIRSALLETYRQDFTKYAKQNQIKYLDLLFKNIPHILGRKFKYSEIGEGIQARELEPCLDLLERAGVFSKVTRTPGNGIPLEAGSDLKYFKTIFLDIALCQKALGSKLGDWIVDPIKQFINKGEIVEAFVGQEILAYSDPQIKEQLFFWHREQQGSEAEVDYLISKNDKVIPVEVKSGTTGHLKSLHLFLDSHPNSPYGIKLSTNNYSIMQRIHFYPLYAIYQAISSLKSVNS